MRSIGVGAAWMILCALSIATLTALAKFAGQSINPWMIIFFQNVVSFAIVLPIQLKDGIQSLKSKHPWLLILRGFLGALCYLIYFIAVTKAPMVDVVLLLNSAPLFTPIVALLWIRERHSKHIWWGIILGFMGIALVLNPSVAVFNVGSIFALITGIIVAFVFVNIRLLSRTEPPIRILFWYFSIASLLTLPFAIVFWSMPTPIVWLAIVGVGVALAFSQFAVNLSMLHGPPSILSPFFYLSIVFAACIDWMFWGVVPTSLVIVGAILVVAGGLWTAWAGRRG